MIHDLGNGGAEKVLVNLVNNMSRNIFDVSVIALFGGGINEQFLKPDVHYDVILKKNIPGNSHLMKLFSPTLLHRLFVKDTYDIEVSYLEGPSARIISGCTNPKTKKVTWFHSMQFSVSSMASSFRNEFEMECCYNSFDKICCVSQTIENAVKGILSVGNKSTVIYNTVESSKILDLSKEVAEEIKSNTRLKLIAVGTLKEVKGFDRLLSIMLRLKNEQYDCELYILGKGPLEGTLKSFVKENDLEDRVFFLGYQINPYKFYRKCDLFICSSYSEGFSTAATEALIVGTPVCTVEVSGMREMLGDNDQYGIITENSEEGLYQGIKSLLVDSKKLNYYKKQAIERGKYFSTEKTVSEVERMLIDLQKEDRQ